MMFVICIFLFCFANDHIVNILRVIVVEFSNEV